MAGATETTFTTSIPARMDRLPWSRFHWLVVIALGVTWILDGLEVTLKGAVSGVLQDPRSLGFSPTQIGFIASSYIAGAVAGSLIFGHFTDRYGRKKMFFVTLAVYLVGVILSAFSWDLWSFALFRFLTGAGIGGEYAAVNSAVDELIPARLRGRVDLIINGSYWLGAGLGSLSTIVLLDPRYFDVDMGWRVGFGIGGILGLSILLLRNVVPESPRWLMVHGEGGEAERITSSIERAIESETGTALPPVTETICVEVRKEIRFLEIARMMFTHYRERTILGLSLMISQAFLYNAIFFTYALVLTRFYGIRAERTGIYLLPFAIGNFLGPLILGHFFDTVGRRAMIAGTYLVSALLLILTGYLFQQNLLSASSQTALWSVIFFFASAAASSAYLTVSEIFPLETRGIAIALFFAIGTGIGGILAPSIFGALIASGSREAIFYGYLFAGVMMIGASIVEVFYGVDAERKSLEDIAPPLSTCADGVQTPEHPNQPFPH
jgi:MFS family permease